MKKLVLFSTLLLSLAGCSESKIRVHADQFNDTQNDTNTPYGNVRDNSAVDNEDGSVTFETDNDVSLTVPVTDTEAGPRYGTPTRNPE